MSHDLVDFCAHAFDPKNPLMVNWLLLVLFLWLFFRHVPPNKLNVLPSAVSDVVEKNTNPFDIVKTPVSVCCFA